jgi:hypothetical protein
VPNVSAPRFIKHTLMDFKTKMDPNTVVVRDFNTHLSPLDRSNKTISKENLDLNEIIDQMDLTEIYKYSILQ